jgi:threonine dehydrogenase-like Zn-dependent dehydrogenase
MKSVPRYLLVRYLGRRWPWLYTSPFACIALREIPEPALPGPAWVRVRTRLCGICGSDLATIRAEGSPYFSPFTSFPFVLGHEIVGEVAEVGADVDHVQPGDRVAVEPALSCAVRGLADLCRPCRDGNYGNCEHVTRGSLSAGIQIGFCRDTGGGFSPSFVAHRLQIHRIPPAIPDEAAVLIEPFSCALHAVLQVEMSGEDRVLVLGCGTMGLLTIAALRAVGSQVEILAAARYPHQAAFAQKLGADGVVSAGSRLYREVAEATGAEVFTPELGKPVLSGGVDVTFDCIGSQSTLDDALRLTRARGRVVVVGMPAIPRGVDWTSIWYKELEVRGAYTYGTESVSGRSQRTFELAIRLLAERAEALAPLVSARFPIGQYGRAIGHAMRAGRSGAVKTVFEFREGAGAGAGTGAGARAGAGAGP